MEHTTPIKLNKEFKRAYYRGRSFATPVIVVYVLKNRLGHNRLGLTASKKVGCAVERNRARRVMREAYRLLEPTLGRGWDFVLVARTRTAHEKMQTVRSALESASKVLFKQK